MGIDDDDFTSKNDFKLCGVYIVKVVFFRENITFFLKKKIIFFKYTNINN
jgi:hypothetical protein